MKTKFVLISILVFFLTYSSFSQEIEKKPTKAEYIYSLIKNTSAKNVKLLTQSIDKSYSSDWLSNVAVIDRFIVFKKGDVEHSWDVESAVFIEVTNENIDIYLSVEPL